MALTFTNLLAGGGFTGLSGTSGTITPTVAVNAGDVIAIGYHIGGATTFSSVNDGDGINTSQYIQGANFHDNTNNVQVGVFYKVVGQANSPATAINLTYTNSFINSFAMKISGFTGFATIGAINGTTFSQTTSSTAVAWTPLVTDKANEALLMVMGVVSGGSPSSGFGSWSNFSDTLFRQAPATSGTNVAVTAGVWSVATAWDAILFAIYDAPTLPFGTTIQSASFNDTSIVASHTLTFTNNVRKGSGLFAAMTLYSGATLPTVSDNLNGAWGPGDIAQDGVGPFVYLFSLPNSVTGICTVTVALGTSGAVALWIGEVSQIGLHDILDAKGSAASASGTGSPQAVTTKSTLFLPEFSICAVGYTVDVTPTARFGYTVDTNGNVTRLGVETQTFSSTIGVITGGFTLSPAPPSYSCVVATYVGVLPVPNPPMDVNMIQMMAQ